MSSDLWDPEKTKAMPISMRYNDAAVVMELEEWIVVYEVLESISEDPEFGEEERMFLARLLEKLSAWVKNSGFREFPEGYVNQQ